MRGKPLAAPFTPPPRRLIPAHAGKTTVWPALGIVVTAHPRACGENILQSCVARPRAGSSPRMRGKPCDRREAFRRRLAHPRACGENANVSSSERAHRGSSPRMRGKQLSTSTSLVHSRLIPAHAGKTRGVADVADPYGAHPRACGENAERSGVLALRSVRSWKTFSFPSSLKVTHCRAFVQLPFSRIRL